MVGIVVVVVVVVVVLHGGEGAELQRLRVVLLHGACLHVVDGLDLAADGQCLKTVCFSVKYGGKLELKISRKKILRWVRKVMLAILAMFNMCDSICFDTVLYLQEVHFHD